MSSGARLWAVFPECPLARAVQKRLASTPFAALRRLIAPAVDHALHEECGDCIAVLASLADGSGPYDEPVGELWPDEPELESRALRIAAKLADMPVSRRRMYLLQSRAACTRPVVEALLAEARSRLSTDSGKAVEIAEVAVFCADNVRPGQYEESVWSDLQAMALTGLGGAHRRDGNLRAAADALEEAEAAATLGSHHPRISIGLLEKKGWLAIDQGLHQQALELFAEAVEIAGAAGDRHVRGRCLYNQAIAFRLLERYREALDDLHVAAMLLDIEREPRLGLITLLELARCSEAASHLDAALAFLDRAERGWIRFMNAGDRIRASWTRGRIHAAAGELIRARSHYAQARQGFVELDYPFDAALVTLELAATLAEEGRFAEVGELAGEILDVFRAVGVEKEARTAVHLLREARSVAAVRRATAAISRLRETVRSSRPGR